MGLLCSFVPLISCADAYGPGSAFCETFYSWPDSLSELQAGEVFRNREQEPLPEVFDFSPDMKKSFRWLTRPVSLMVTSPSRSLVSLFQNFQGQKG